MGVPKRRQSKARKNKRRSIVSKVEGPGLVRCTHCHQLKQPHRVCSQCGYYKGRQVVAAEK